MHDKKRKKELGIFYTDEKIVDFIYDILIFWKEKEDKETNRWHFSSGKSKYPSVIDPACGEGIFLKKAIEKSFTLPRYVFGVDIDINAKKKWEEINLLKEFGSRAELDVHFIHQDGLLPLPDRVLRYKRGGLKEFDVVVGNPPYGGIGIKFSNKKLDSYTKKLLETLEKFEIFQYKLRKEVNNKRDENLTLFEIKPQQQIARNKIPRLAESIPIEILFIERFIQLVKPGGYIAIILPDGIFANANLHYVREFIKDKTKVEAIISLPRSAFKNVGTSAKTSILFLRKPRDIKEIENLEYNVFLGAVEDINKLKDVFEFYKEVYEMNNVKEKVKVIKDEKGNEVAMVRVDKTLKEMMEEEPYSRWDPEYWRPSQIFSPNLFKLPFRKLGEFIIEIVGGKDWDSKRSKPGDVLFIRTINILDTGIHIWRRRETVEEGGYNDSPKLRLKEGDVLLTRNSFRGTNTLLGRSICIHRDFGKIVPCGDIRIIRVDREKINPFYVSIFLKTKFGQLQIYRFSSGVDSGKINNKQIEDILVPLPPWEVQKNIEEKFREILQINDKSVEYKEKGDEDKYEKYLRKAERLLNDLISKTEAVIRGEREDVI